MQWAIGISVHTGWGACQVPCSIVPPASLNITAAGKLATKPWGRDQKLAALAAWQVLRH